jgi:hypothetical protein
LATKWAANERAASFGLTDDGQDTITGMLLAGTGHINDKGKKNFLVVDSSARARPPMDPDCVAG